MKRLIHRFAEAFTRFVLEHRADAYPGVQVPPSPKRLFALDDDWFRYYPFPAEFEVHELCSGCEPDGSCPFHPPGCDSCGGLCPGGKLSEGGSR